MRILVLIAALLALVSCQSNSDPDAPPSSGDLALLIAFDTAYGTLQAFVASGDVSEGAVQFMDATVAYAGGGCAVLTDTTTTPEQKRFALLVDLADERATFDREFTNLVDADLDPRLIPAIEGAKSAARLYATYRADPEFWQRPCNTVEALVLSWQARRPLAMIPVPQLRPASMD